MDLNELSGIFNLLDTSITSNNDNSIDISDQAYDDFINFIACYKRSAKQIKLLLNTINKIDNLGIKMTIQDGVDGIKYNSFSEVLNDEKYLNKK